MSSISIPTERTKKALGLGDQVITLYGQPKIGKSTFAGQFPNALFAATEPGLNFLEVYQVPVGNWADFTKLCAVLARDPLHVETLVVDTIDILYDLCEKHVCGLAGIAHPSDASYGKGCSMVKSEFKRVLSKLGTLRTRDGGKMGLGIISHTRVVEEETRPGTNKTFAMNLSNSPRIVVESMSDLLLFADVEPDGTRVLRTKPSTKWVAGDRTGKLPETLPLNYDALSSAFSGTKKENGDV